MYDVMHGVGYYITEDLMTISKFVYIYKFHIII